MKAREQQGPGSCAQHVGAPASEMGAHGSSSMFPPPLREVTTAIRDYLEHDICLCLSPTYILASDLGSFSTISTNLRNMINFLPLG